MKEVPVTPPNQSAQDTPVPADNQTTCKQYDDLKLAAMILKRLKTPESTDTDLESFATELGIDLDKIRQDVAQGKPNAQYEF